MNSGRNNGAASFNGERNHLSNNNNVYSNNNNGLNENYDEDTEENWAYISERVNYDEKIEFNDDDDYEEPTSQQNTNGKNQRQIFFQY